MKNLFYAICGILLFVSCGITKKIETSKSTSSVSKIKKETTKDSVTKIKEVLPTESTMVFDIESLSKMVGDFVQEVNSGNGNKSTISKKGRKLYVSTKNLGSKSINTNVKEKETEQIYNSDFVICESKKFVKRVPIKYWIYLSIILIFYNRRLISSILTFFFPVLRTKRIFSYFLK